MILVPLLPGLLAGRISSRVGLVLWRMATIDSPPPRTLAVLPADLLTLVAEKLRLHCLASFAAACAACQAAVAQQLCAALLLAVRRCLVPSAGRAPQRASASHFSIDRCLAAPYFTSAGRWPALVACRHFRLPDDLPTLPEGAFIGCTSLTSLRLPASITAIGDGAFRGCISLTELALPATLTTIGAFAFHRCTRLAALTLPPSLTTIGTGAFKGCSSLTELTLPASVTAIGAGAFDPPLTFICLGVGAAPWVRTTLGTTHAHAPNLCVDDDGSSA